MGHHRLLARQVQRHLDAAARVDPALADLLAVVSRAYDQADADRELLERSLELTSQELMARNDELSAAMHQAGLSFWALEPGAALLSLQGYGPVGFAEVRGRAAFPIAAVLARVDARRRVEVALDLARQQAVVAHHTSRKVVMVMVWLCSAHGAAPAGLSSPLA